MSFHADIGVRKDLGLLSEVQKWAIIESTVWPWTLASGLRTESQSQGDKDAPVTGKTHGHHGTQAWKKKEMAWNV